MRTELHLFLLVALTCSCSVEADECIESRAPLAFDQAGPWDVAPAEALAHVEGQRVGSLTWLGGGEAGAMSPATGTSDITLVAVVDQSSAVGVDLEHVGDGRLACTDTIEARASVTLTSVDGSLDEQLELEIVAAGGDVGNVVVGQVELSDHVWGGSFSWAPNSASEQLFLRVSWTNDATSTARGWLIWGDQNEVEVQGDTVTGAGVSRVLAEFVAQ